ncbi:DUF350 domain-containing protein [Sulfurimonas aquatica]|uniref:DUF350 domain-containing protein n=1 Tax=Sulfurimonas aquatica TaxID=2672570 RepID=A0A975GD40_9BACT|nr:DUF350 domain-containing protein [Sulfurimonas aquatica]QSZ42187.1 DUF350 domain-containing protein [Sulfurimonas aquatica]
METDFIEATYFAIGMNLGVTFVTLVASVIFLLVIDKVLLKNIDLQSEIQKGNIAAAIFASSIMIFIAIIVGMGIR